MRADSILVDAAATTTSTGKSTSLERYLLLPSPTSLLTVYFNGEQKHPCCSVTYKSGSNHGFVEKRFGDNELLAMSGFRTSIRSSVCKVKIGCIGPRDRSSDLLILATARELIFH